MKRNRFLALSKVAALASVVTFASGAQAAFKVVGYFPGWQGDVNTIQYSKLTHLHYAFVLPTATGGLQPLGGGEARLTTLVEKAHAAGVKVLISVGGWNKGDDSAFISIAQNSAYRSAFINNIANFVSRHKLDGVDIVWEYADAGTEATQYRVLMQELSTRLKSQGKLLTAAVDPSDAAGSVDAGVINAVDYMNIMAFDMGTPHSTYAHAQNALTHWRYNEGLPKTKTVLAIPFYSGKGWVAYKDIISRWGTSAAQIDTAGDFDYNGQPTVRAKAELAKNEADGIAFWEVSQDTTDATSLMTTAWNVVGNATVTRIAIPGTLEAENYTGFQDSTAGNSGGVLRNDNVDIQVSTQNGHNIGWIDAGEWLEYPITISKAGKYKLESLVAAQATGGRFQVALNTSNAQTLATVAVPATGGWQTWQWLSTEVTLPAGEQRLRITMEQGGFNLNALRFTEITDNGTDPGAHFPAWQSGKTYAVGDIVSMNGKAYYAALTNTGNAVTNEVYWHTYSGSAANGGPLAGRYTLRAVHSGKCLDVTGASNADNAAIQQYGCGGAGAQAFDLTLEGGYYHIINASSKKGIAVAGSATTDGTRMHQWTAYNLDNQRFTFIDKGNGQYEVRAKHSGKCVDVAGDLTTDAAPVQQWTCNNKSNQRWLLTKSDWKPSNSTPTAAKKQHIMNFLYGISGKQTLVGVENKSSASPTSHTDLITSWTGKVSSFWGADFGFGDTAVRNRPNMIAEAKRQFAKGALVGLMYHPCAPTQNEYCSWDDIGGAHPVKFSNDQFRQLLTPGTGLHNAWIGRLNTLATYFQDLKNSGVVVLFRPFHEMNQCAFWWSCKTGTYSTAALYRMTYDYLSKTKGLDNIIWVWNMQDFSTLNTDVDKYNPGTNYFDIASLDVYNTGLTLNNYNTMLRVAGGKPIALAEVGKMPTIEDLRNQPRWIFAMVWPDFLYDTPSERWAYTHNRAIMPGLYKAANVLTLDEMPGWK